MGKKKKGGKKAEEGSGSQETPPSAGQASGSSEPSQKKEASPPEAAVKPAPAEVQCAGDSQRQGKKKTKGPQPGSTGDAPGGYFPEKQPPPAVGTKLYPVVVADPAYAQHSLHGQPPFGFHSQPLGLHSQSPTGLHSQPLTGLHSQPPTGLHSQPPTGLHSQPLTGLHSQSSDLHSQPSGLHSQFSGVYNQPGLQSESSGLLTQTSSLQSPPLGIYSQFPGVHFQPPGFLFQPGLQSQPPGLQSQPPGLQSQPPGLQSQPPGLQSQPPGLQSQPPGLQSQPPGLQSQPPGLQPQHPGLHSQHPGLQSQHLGFYSPEMQSTHPGLQMSGLLMPPSTWQRPPPDMHAQPEIQPHPSVSVAQMSFENNQALLGEQPPRPQQATQPSGSAGGQQAQQGHPPKQKGPRQQQGQQQGPPQQGQQQGPKQAQRGPQQGQQQGPPWQGQQQGPQQGQRGPQQGQQQGPPWQGQQQGPQQGQRGPQQGQQQGPPWQGQQQGPQQGQRGPQQGQRGPQQGQQQGPQQGQRGPQQGQQQGPPWQGQQQGPQQGQRGPQHGQQGPPWQGQQQSPPQQGQQRGPQQGQQGPPWQGQKQGPQQQHSGQGQGQQQKQYPGQQQHQGQQQQQYQGQQQRHGQQPPAQQGQQQQQRGWGQRDPQQGPPQQAQQQTPQQEPPQQQPPQQQPPQQQAWGKRGGPQQAPQQEQPPHPQPQQKVSPPQQGPQGGRGRGRADSEGSQTSLESGGSQRQPSKGKKSDDSMSMKGMQKEVERVAQKQEPKESGDSKSLVKVPPLEVKLKRTLGTQGRKILVETNHLPLQLGNYKQAVHYDVSFVPDKPKRLYRAAMSEFQKKYYPKRFPAFDGIKNLYSAFPLSDKLIDGEVEVRSPDDDRIHTFKITVKWAADVDLTVLRTYLETDDQRKLDTLNLQEALQCVDIVLRSAPSMTFIPVGRSYFTEPSEQVYLGDGMGLYHGFYLSSILGWKPYVNVDVAHKAFPIGITIIDLIKKMFNFDNPMDIMNVRSERDYETLQKFLKGLKIEYSIPPNRSSRRVYKVNGLAECASRVRFKKDDGSVMTVEEYMLKDKNYRLKYPNLFTLWCGNEKREQRMLFAAELCAVVKDQVVNRKLTENQTRNMIKAAATDTRRRKANIQNAITKANFNQSSCVQEFGFHVTEKFEQVKARILEPPRILYEQSETQVRKGVWNASRFSKAATIGNWTILNLDRYVKGDDLVRLGREIVQKGSKLGMSILEPQRPFDTLQMVRMREMQQKFDEYKRKKMDLVIVVIPSNNDITYGIVKKAAEIHAGCLTQCLKSFTLQRKFNEATVINILMKINAKRNGVNHKLSPQTFPTCLRRPCMIMGADVTHPSPDARDIPSVAAVTASFEPNAFRYNICWRLQPPKMEIISDLENITLEQLKFFHFHNKGTKPQHIIFYRDGVSDGQFAEVLHTELRAIQNACRKIQADGYQPAITFLIVQKRHHTRFFPTNERDSEDRNCNVPAGTCVDTAITNFRAQDFYLVSHASIQGVAKPTKYRTLHDDKNMHEDELEQLTYYLCHMFARCTRSVSYPAPTYYAHLAAARAKVYCENRPIQISSLQREQESMTIKEEIIKDLPMFFV